MPVSRALVVDDNRLNRDMLSGQLRIAGYETLVACDGAEAWEVLDREGQTLDVVLLDRRMPNMDGMEVLARVKASPALQPLPVILQTAADSEQEIIEGIQAGAFYYLTKPFKPEVLLSVTAAAVADHARYRALQRGVDRQTSVLGLMRWSRFTFRTVREGSDLATTLAAAFPDPQRQVIGLSELLTNAVEHGNAGITYEEKSQLLADRRFDEEVAARLARPETRDKVVEVVFDRRPDRIVLTITDEGEGFDWRRYLEMDPKRVFDAHGRGIALARTISFDCLEYKGCGNCVEATVTCQPASATASPPHPTARVTPPAPTDHGEPSRTRLVTVQDRLMHTYADLQAYRSRLDEDLGAARRMQHELLPDAETIATLEERHRVTLGSHFESSSELGGDLFGVNPIDDDRFALWMVDFSGHGVSAALNTFRLHTLLTGFPEWMEHPGEYLSLLGARLAALLPTGQYATAFYGVLDTRAGLLRYAAAAAPPPLFADTATGTVSTGDGSGLPLGIDAGTIYETREVTLPSNHLVFLYSDALLECADADGAALGRQGVRSLLADALASRREHVSLTDILDPFLGRVRRPLVDDLTAVLCLRRPRPT